MSEHPRRRVSARERIRRLEALPEFPATRRGRMPYAGADGRIVVFEGPLRSLGQGIPRRRSRIPFVWRLQRAAWHMALGYASGFPVRAILAFTARNYWRIPDVDDPTESLDAIIEFEDVDVPDPNDLEPAAYARGGIVDRAFGQSVPAAWVEPAEAFIPLTANRQARARRILDDLIRRLRDDGELGGV
jgi:hypothetical protein